MSAARRRLVAAAVTVLAGLVGAAVMAAVTFAWVLSGRLLAMPTSVCLLALGASFGAALGGLFVREQR